MAAIISVNEGSIGEGNVKISITTAWHKHNAAQHQQPWQQQAKASALRLFMATTRCCAAGARGIIIMRGAVTWRSI